MPLRDIHGCIQFNEFKNTQKMKPMLVTMKSYTAGAHPKPVLDAIRILINARLKPSRDFGIEALCIAHRQLVQDTDGKVRTVSDIMYKYNVRDVTKESGDGDGDGDRELDVLMRGLYTLLTKTPTMRDTSHEVAIFPYSVQYADNECPYIKRKVHIDAIGTCEKWPQHVAEIKKHMQEFSVESFSALVYTPRRYGQRGIEWHVAGYNVHGFNDDGEGEVKLDQVHNISRDVIYDSMPKTGYTVMPKVYQEEDDEGV